MKFPRIHRKNGRVPGIRAFFTNLNSQLSTMISGFRGRGRLPIPRKIMGRAFCLHLPNTPKMKINKWVSLRKEKFIAICCGFWICNLPYGYKTAFGGKLAGEFKATMLWGSGSKFYQLSDSNEVFCWP